MNMSTKEANAFLQKMPKAHPGIPEWIYTFCALNAYVIFDRKSGKAVCTRCGKEFKAEDWMRHNEYGECPKCGCSIQYKTAGRGRGNCRETFRVLECSHRGKTVWACSWEVSLNFENFGRPIVGRFLADVFVINDKEERHYKHKHDWYMNEWSWEEVNTMNLPHVMGGSMYGYNVPPLENVYIYRNNLESVFTKSCMKYLWDRAFINVLDAFQLINYMSMGVKWQGVELLHKAGFQKLTMQRINKEYGSGCCYWAGKSLTKVLRMPPRDVKYVREKNPTFSEIKTFKEIPDEYRRKIPWEAMSEIGRYRYPGDWTSEPGYKEYVRRLTEYTDLKSWIKYITREREGRRFTLDDWIDYIEAARKLGMDLRSRKMMFPEDFWKAHDETMDIIAEQKEAARKKEEEARIRYLTELSEKMKQINFESGNLMIKVATSQEQLNLESGSLHHCVKTYGEKLMSGKCLIFFVREKDHPEESFFTLETDIKGNFRQCRGLRNCDMPIDVKAFVDKFTTYLEKTLIEREAA